MVIGRGRRRQPPNQHFVLLLSKKYGKKIRGKKYGKKVRPDKASSGHVTLSLPVKKAPLGRTLRNFRLRIRRTYFQTGPLPDRASSGHVTHVTSGHFRSCMRNGPIPLDPPQM